MTIRAQVTLPRITNLPRDVATNVFHFGGAGFIDDAANLDKVELLLRLFYETLRPLYSNEVVFNDARIKMYDMGDPTPRQPVRDVPLNAAGNNPDDGLPSEVAAVISWKAHPAAGIPAARTRGRTYIGPCSRSMQAAGDRDHISGAMQITLRDAAFTLIQQGVAQVCPLVIWSPKDYTDPKGVVHPKKPPQAANMVHNVFDGFVDNAFDTQRRRGKSSTFRNNIGVVPGA